MDKTQIATKDAPAAIGPYSQAISAGDFLFISGQIPIDSGTGAVSGSTIAEQTVAVLNNIGSVLRAARLDYKDVVKTTVFITDMGGFAEMNQVYAKYFKDPAPARSTVQVSGLPKGALVEIETIALRRAKSKKK